MTRILRTVTVYDQNTQEKNVFENIEAETFGDLKAVLSRKGINFTDMDVREGISRINLKADSAILPHDTPYRGGTTNDLMILLTKTNKKVSSGAELTRPSAVAYIKEHNLQEEVKAKYRRNYTNVSTADLVVFVEGKMGAAKKTPAGDENPKGPTCAPADNLKPAFLRLVEILEYNAAIDEDEAEELRDLVGKKPVVKKSACSDKGFSDDEIFDAIKSM